jgi:hypothetical protein
MSDLPTLDEALETGFDIDGGLVCTFGVLALQARAERMVEPRYTPSQPGVYLVQTSAGPRFRGAWKEQADDGREITHHIQTSAVLTEAEAERIAALVAADRAAAGYAPHRRLRYEDVEAGARQAGWRLRKTGRNRYMLSRGTEQVPCETLAQVLAAIGEA